MRHQSDSTITTAPLTVRRRPQTPWSTDLAATAAAAVCALVTWTFVAWLPGLDLTVTLGGQVNRVGPVSVAVASAVAALAGFTLLRLLERLTARALRVWLVIATVFALLSVAGPLGAAGTRTAALALVSLHAVVASVVIAAGWRSRR